MLMLSPWNRAVRGRRCAARRLLVSAFVITLVTAFVGLPIKRRDGRAPVDADQTGAPVLPLHALPIEFGFAAGAENFERAIGTHGVRALENPVLPCRQAAEHARLHG